ncbi:MAG: hypothetical protein ISS66_09565 [Desulfobacteraceae bacterium]|nr:hypothetical protein [Desulfobacteraceae bacterium]
MGTIRDRPLFTDTYANFDDFSIENENTYVFGTSVEERSSHIEKWKGKIGNVIFVSIFNQESNSISVEIEGNVKILALRSGEQLRNMWNDLKYKTVYLDITGLSHHIWAPLLKASLTTCTQVMVVYVEPGDYRFSAAPKEGEIFDLSERITGISPIPGFVSLKEPKEEVCFVPLLGFEGTRFAYLIEQVQPPGERILPIIGVPGFRPEYPFFAYHGNQQPLIRSHAWQNVRFAIANCPFSLYYILEDIATDYPGHFIKIAPIGVIIGLEQGQNHRFK